MNKESGFARLGSKEQKKDAIDRARSVLQLDEMWGVWEKQGYSKEGLLYAQVLDKKVEFGDMLSPADAKRRSSAASKKAAGAALPPIKGTVKI